MTDPAQSNCAALLEDLKNAQRFIKIAMAGVVEAIK